jgi:UDP-GlcNAc:undecaprenyl-phosphate GlcNAc-1-phosphate transferase
VTDIVWLAVPALAAAAMTLVLTPLVARLAILVGAIDVPDERKVHRTPVPRLGGVAVVASIAMTFAAASWLSSGRWELPPHLAAGIGLGVLPILLISIADDIRPIPALNKFLAHTLGAAIAVVMGISLAPVVHLFGGEIHIGWMAGPLSILWIVGITNAFNLIDGLDGLSAGLALIAAASMAVVFTIVGQPGMAVTSLVLAGALLGFLPYNVHPARQFLGDTGATAIGFCLGAFALRGGSTLSSGFAALLPVFILGLPIADMLIAMARRTLHRIEYHAGGIFEADRNHIHHRLLALGVEHRTAVLTLYGAGLALAGTALASLLVSAREAALMVTALLLAGVVGVHRLGYDEFAFIKRGTVLKFYELRTVKRGFFIVFVDLSVTFVAAYVSVVLKTDRWTFPDVGRPVLELATTFAPITVAVFSWCRMYRGSWRAAGLHDLTRIVVAIGIATPSGALVLNLLSSNVYSPSLFVIYGGVSFLLTASLRASYVILEHSSLRSSRRGEPVLIYGAGRRGAAAVHELLKNREINLRPVGFIDDDVNKRGRIVSGLPVLGSARDIEHTLRATSASGMLISSGKIAAHHVERAAQACHRTHGKLFHLDIGVHRLDHEESTPPVAAAPSFVDCRPASVFSFGRNRAAYLAQRCPLCTCVHIHRSKARSVFERLKKLRTDKRLYRCEECGWRGWLTPLDCGVRFGSTASASFDPGTLDIVVQANSPLVRSGIHSRH